MSEPTPLAALRELLLQSNGDMALRVGRKFTGREAGLLAEWLIAHGLFARAEAAERERQEVLTNHHAAALEWDRKLGTAQARVAALEAGLRPFAELNDAEMRVLGADLYKPLRARARALLADTP